MYGINDFIIQAREIIANVLQFMKDEAANKCCTIPITNFKERLIAATKIAERTSRDIVKEADDVRLGAASGFSRLIAATKIAERTSRDIVKEADDVRLGAASGFSSPSKKRKRPSPKISIPERETEVIRTIVYNFYVELLSDEENATTQTLNDEVSD
ncbi:hypothetical protein QE152_g10196 [Popillia japonica]|uniref:Uncharacterized protein n=1 Tax=Popillia japonica TaxID=7064 RepID=A0AAW1LX82_POPJA